MYICCFVPWWNSCGFLDTVYVEEKFFLIPFHSLSWIDFVLCVINFHKIRWWGDYGVGLVGVRLCVCVVFSPATVTSWLKDQSSFLKAVRWLCLLLSAFLSSENHTIIVCIFLIVLCQERLKQSCFIFVLMRSCAFIRRDIPRY